MEGILNDSYTMCNNISTDLLVDLMWSTKAFSFIIELIYTDRTENRLILWESVGFFIYYEKIISEQSKTLHWLNASYKAFLSKLLYRFKALLNKHNKKIYLYRCNPKIKNFCKKHYIRYEDLSLLDEAMFIKRIGKYTKENNIY